MTFRPRFRALCLSLAAWGLLGACPSLRAAVSLLNGPTTLVYPSFWHTPFGIHRGTPALLKLFLGDQTRFDDPQGLACAHLWQSGPEDDQVTVIGVNSGASCLVYNPSMEGLAVYGRPGAGAGCFNHPVGVAMLPNGRVAVADAGNNRVALLLLRQDGLEWQRALGGPGSGDGQFEDPSGVAFDSQGRLFVADTGNNRVQVFSPSGDFLYSFGSEPGQGSSLQAPTAIAVTDPRNPYTCCGESALFVVDDYHTRLQKFSPQGDLLAEAEGADLGRLLVYFNSLALDYFNNVWVTDSSNDQVHKFTRQLVYLDSYGSPGKGDGQFDSPRGIAINRHYGQVFVVEADSSQYFWIGADLKNLALSRQAQSDGTGLLRIDFTLTERAKVEADILDDQGGLVFPVFRGQMEEGEQSLYWDGRDQKGALASPGAYRISIRVEATYSSAGYFAKRVTKRFYIK